MKELLGDVIYAYTRSQAIADGELIDVTDTAKEAGVKFPTAITAAVWNEYVTVPEELKGQQDVMGRLWDILWMFAYAVRSRQMKSPTARPAAAARPAMGAESHA